MVYKKRDDVNYVMYGTGRFFSPEYLFDHGASEINVIRYSEFLEGKLPLPMMQYTCPRQISQNYGNAEFDNDCMIGLNRPFPCLYYFFLDNFCIFNIYFLYKKYIILLLDFLKFDKYNCYNSGNTMETNIIYVVRSAMLVIRHCFFVVSFKELNSYFLIFLSRRLKYG